MPSHIEKLKRLFSILTQTIQAAWSEFDGLHALVEKILLDPKPTVLIQCTDRETILVLKEGEKNVLRREVLDAPLHVLASRDSDQWADQLIGHCATRELHLSLNASDVFCTHFHIPEKSIRNAHEAAKYRLLTESPIRLESAVFDVKVKAAKSRERVVEVALCRSEVLGRMTEQLGRIDLHVSEIGFARAGMDSLEFRFKRLDALRSASSRLRRNIFLAMGPALIFLFALFATWAYSARKEAGLQKDIASLSVHAEQSVQLLARRAHLLSIKRKLHEDMTSVSTVALLNEIGKVLPKSAWLIEVRIENGKIRLIGNGADPSAVAKALAAASGLSSVQLGSVISLPQSETMQRFEIDAEIATVREK